MTKFIIQLLFIITMKTKLIIAALFIGIFLSFDCKKDNEYSGNAKYIVFTNAYFWEGTNNNNNTVLITDSAEIRELEMLLVDNDLSGYCKCGYDYEIQFFNAKHELIYFRSLNTDADFYKKHNKEIREKMKRLAEQTQSAPTHYLYNLKINVQMPSEPVMTVLKQKGLISFMLGNQEDQYPKLKLTYCEPDEDDRNLDDAEAKFKEIVQRINFKTQPVDSSYVHRTTTHRTKYVDFRTNKISRIYYFPTGTNIDSIIKKVDELKIKYFFAETCAQYYYLQLLNKKNDMEQVSDYVKEYKFIEDISKVQEGFTCEKCDLSN